jgi:hypothetical protein
VLKSILKEREKYKKLTILINLGTKQEMIQFIQQRALQSSTEEIAELFEPFSEEVIIEDETNQQELEPTYI